MKKSIAVVLIVILIAVSATYIFIPSTIKISSVAEGKANPKGAYRFLLNDENWSKWWPGSNPFYFNGTNFKLVKKMLTSFEFQLTDKSDPIKSVLEIIPLKVDSTAFQMSCELESSNNPVKRLMQYLEAIHIKKNMDTITSSMKNYLSLQKNLYGFDVKNSKVTDYVLISTKSIFDHYPDVNEIGLLVQKLKDYIKKENAMENNYPMLNVHQVGTNEYEAMVAIATDKVLPATKDFFPKRVLQGGNILEAEFNGGPFATQKAFDSFENFKQDFEITSPAIPYQLMVSDRAMQKDTSAWITKFYYPIY